MEVKVFTPSTDKYTYHTDYAVIDGMRTVSNFMLYSIISFRLVNLMSSLLLCCRFAGPMERLQAEAELINRVNSTYLVRHRSREYTEYAISIKYV